jgi:hypothetical protein
MAKDCAAPSGSGGVAPPAGVQHHRIDARQARDRFTQRTGRQQPAVAEAARVDHRDLEVAPQRVMLQAVVEHQHVALRMRC